MKLSLHGCCLLAVSILWPLGCLPCGPRQVRSGLTCVAVCNSDGECRQDEQCLDGVCVMKDVSGSSGSGGLSSSLPPNSTSSASGGSQASSVPSSSLAGSSGISTSSSSALASSSMGMPCPRQDAGTEAICRDGGAAIWCEDFERAADWTQANFNYEYGPDVTSSLRIVNVSANGCSAVGNRFVRGEPLPGSAGSDGLARMDLTQGYNSLALRYYVRFAQGFAGGIIMSGPGFSSGAGTGCNVYARSNISPAFLRSGFFNNDSCPGGYTYDEGLPQAEPRVLQNNRWYRVEQQVVGAVPCDGGSCPGLMRMWVDGTLIYERTDINWGAATSPQWNRIYGPQLGMPMRVPPWGGEVDFDNFIVTSPPPDAPCVGGCIGPAELERPMGEADPESPYVIWEGLESYVGGYVRADSLAPDAGCQIGYGGPLWLSFDAFEYRTRPPINCPLNCDRVECGCRFPSDVTHGPPVCTPDGAMHVVLGPDGGVSQGSGNMYENFNHPNGANAAAHYFIHGWIRFPASADFNAWGLPALVGYARYGGNPWGRHVALSVSPTGHFVVVQREGGANIPRTITTDVEGPTVIPDAWHEFELHIRAVDKEVTLWVDGTLMTGQMDLNANWYPPDKMVVGVMDHTSGAPLELWVDDISMGSVSFTGCTGWGTASCPF